MRNASLYKIGFTSAIEASIMTLTKPMLVP